MPKNKKQEILFGLIMSYPMAYGMEVYNVAIKKKDLPYRPVVFST
ncbi:hypothetical protein [Pseudoramibacter faecis]|nr:hypothetical protein [Pseudoramibacter sp. HA2172]